MRSAGSGPLGLGRNVADHRDRSSPPRRASGTGRSSRAAGRWRCPARWPRATGRATRSMPLPQHVGRPVEVVVAERGGGVAQPAEQLHAGAPARSRSGPACPASRRPRRAGAGRSRSRRPGCRARRRARPRRAGSAPWRSPVARTRSRTVSRAALGSGGVGTPKSPRTARSATSGTMRQLETPAYSRRVERAPGPHRVDEQLGDPLALVVDHRRVAEHVVAAGAGLPVAVDRHGEAVGRLRPAGRARARRWIRSPTGRRRSIVVLRAGDHVVVVARAPSR